MAEFLAKEARQRWEENNLDPNYTNKIGDIPTAKHGVDDITVLIAFFKFGTKSDKREKKEIFESQEEEKIIVDDDEDFG